ncbi:NB-ARC domain-containing protein [Amycolatopsis sp. cmx-11-12]|uniref:NB-ARC domain-containing protein n=1 Tax=Amycolatopsis sp. cmx-11-12 TaxID=2785795 RepID=UPI003918061B
MVNVATGGTSPWFEPFETHPLWWMAGGVLATTVAGVLLWWVPRRYDRRLTELLPAAQRPKSWVVNRPAEVHQVVSALLPRATVGITTAVHGAGGFGKTTVATLVRANTRVLRQFRGGVYWVTLGRDARSREAIVEKVNDLLKQLAPERPVTFTDQLQASDHLAAVLVSRV